MTDDLIESILNESRSFAPSKDFVGRANIDKEKAFKLLREVYYMKSCK